MLMVSEVMRIGVVTGHIPLSEVSKNITEDLILKKLRILNSSLIRDFGIRKPRIAILGLNPHAGDAGILGKEEQDIIIPAIKKANDENIIALGPYPSDGFFGSDNFSKYDGILAMYHDQGLAPFKALAFDSGVNFTAGLPIVRTSPAHGTAFEIAGQAVASENSFRNALMLALEIYKHRANYDELTKNPLKITQHE
jgi:4-hydroxythreonine-4-phosphate dehydrogenase